MFDKEKAKSILLDLHMKLESINIRHALICGTALGAYRNNDFLSEDIDILCDAKDYWKFRAFFDKDDEFEYNCIWRREIALYKYGRKIDVLFADIEGNETSIYIYKLNSITGKYHTEQRYVWQTEHIFPYSIIEFMGTLFNIPNNCPEFFKTYYGEGWETPNKNWNRNNSPPPNLDKEYRQIDILINQKENPLSFESCKEVYDSDWVRMCPDTSINPTAPLCIEVRGIFCFTKNHNLNILNEILLSEHDITEVTANSKNNYLKKSPISKSNSEGYLYHNPITYKSSIIMYKNRPLSRFDIGVTTEDFFNETQIL